LFLLRTFKALDGLLCAVKKLLTHSLTHSNNASDYVNGRRLRVNHADKCCHLVLSNWGNFRPGSG